MVYPNVSFEAGCRIGKPRMSLPVSDDSDFINDPLLSPLTPALQRRIRRHVNGPVQSFFAITVPGLEFLCRDELLQRGIPDDQIKPIVGGVEFTGRLSEGYLANLHLRTATRVLMRIAEFKASNFQQLEKKTAEIAWELFLYPGFTVEINVSTHKSRLSHTAAIAERVDRTIADRLGAQRVVHPIFSQRIFIRSMSDQFTVSIDSSGQALYKRGIKTHGGRAPLRETGAAAILQLMGYSPGMTLIDPMCGSGSFSIEAALMSRNIPPGWFRDFAFMGWPAFRSRQWQHLKEEAKSRFIDAAPISIHASDKDPGACESLRICLESFDLSQVVQIQCLDFLDLKTNIFMNKDKPRAAGLMVFNPPFGKRLGSEAESRSLFRTICRRLKSEFKGWRFALLMPREGMIRKLPFPFESRPFYHGGLKLVLLTGTVK
jgi:putative N6-adenine-specific DNA methylase